jgi:ribonuclease HI
MSLFEWTTIALTVCGALMGFIVKLAFAKLAEQQKANEEKHAAAKAELAGLVIALHVLETKLHDQQIEFLTLLSRRKTEREIENRAIYERIDKLLQDSMERREKWMQALADMRETAAGFQSVYITRHEVNELGLSRPLCNTPSCPLNK